MNHQFSYSVHFLPPLPNKKQTFVVLILVHHAFGDKCSFNAIPNLDAKYFGAVCYSVCLLSLISFLLSVLANKFFLVYEKLNFKLLQCHSTSSNDGRRFGQDISRIPVRSFSNLELGISPRDHVYGAMVLDVLGHCTSIQRLKIMVYRYQVSVLFIYRYIHSLVSNEFF